MEHIEKIDHNVLHATEVGKRRVASPETDHTIRSLIRKATARGMEDSVGAAIFWVAMLLCADESSHVSANDDEITDFINANLDFLTRRVYEALTAA